MLTLPSGYKVLVDCGLDYEDREHFEANNKNFPFLAEEIDLVILTHAHIDHSGNLPNLIRQGYKGRIICSEPTVELATNLLIDSMNVQQIESHKKKRPERFRKSKLKFKKNREAVALYSRVHIEQTKDAMFSIDFYKPFQVNDELTVEL